SLDAGRDVTVAAVEDRQGQTRWSTSRLQSVTQLGAEVSAGRDLNVSAGRDLSAVASALEARRDIALSAGRDVTLAAAANEEHAYSKTRKVTYQEDKVAQQGTRVDAGGDLAINAGQDLRLIASQASAGDEAYLVAGDKLELLAANDSNYYLYDKKKKGDFGRKETRRDEVTDVKAVGSQISSGGDLTLLSGGDQTYQGAKLESGNDLAIVSGGAVTFEAVKDLHQESHEKSKGDLAWNSAKGKGQTDETLRQTQIVAQGNLAIKAVEGLKIDLKHIDQKTVSQTIDAMVQADPQLAWLKEAEQRGDVDWRMVQEVHDSWKYSNSGLGVGAQLAVAIVVTVLTYGAASAAIGAGAASGSALSAGAAATATTEAVAAGWATVALATGASSLASTGVISTINNKGNIGQALSDTFGSDSLKQAIIAAGVAGFMTVYGPEWVGGRTDPSTNTTTATGNGIGAIPDITNPNAWTSFAGMQLTQGALTGAANELLGQGSFSDAMQGTLYSILQASAFKYVGDLGFPSGGVQNTLAHALAGGLLAEAMGGDFKTGAVAAGASEALANVLTKGFLEGDSEQAKRMQQAAAQLAGIVAAGSVNGDVQMGGDIAKNGMAYNRQLHAEEQKWLEKNAKSFAQAQGITEQQVMERLSQQALKDTDFLWRSVLSDGDDAAAQAFLSGSGKTFVNDLGEQQQLFTATGQQLFRPEMFADGVVDTDFYKQFVHSGISRELSAGLTKEFKDSGIALKDGAIDLAKMVAEHPGTALDGLWEGVKGIPGSVIDGFHESGNAIGEGAATAFDANIARKLNIIYGQDVAGAQEALLAIRVFTAVAGAKTVAGAVDKVATKTAEVVAKKLDKIATEAAEKALLKSGGIVDVDGQPLLDMKKLSTEQKGIIGDLFGEHTVRQIIPDGEKLARIPGVGETGIDDLFKVNRPDVDYVMIEYKFVGPDGKTGASYLGNTLDEKQGSESWMLGSGRLEKAVGDDLAIAVDRSIRQGRTETWVVATRPDGSTEVQILDALGKAKEIDASQILSTLNR
ncbi:TPA: hypothetical protein L4738_003479, partial [Pseudomonas aeruginosa]|nr:hypothetical protein [Pseudomonas aeruginosa]